MAGTLSAAELAARAGITPATLEQEIAATDAHAASGPNRAHRRAMAKATRKAERR